MSRIRYMAIGLPALALLAIASAPLVQAEPNNGRGNSIQARTATETTEVNQAQSARVQEKRAAIREKLAAMKEARTERLDARRLETCEKHEVRINEIMQKRSEQATRHLSVFTKISDRVQEFIADKDLTIEGYDVLVQNIDDKEAAVTAAIDANADNTFDCDEADGENPAKYSRVTMDGVRDALKDYRTSIKDLIVQVKSDAASQSDDADSTSETTGTEEEAETNTEAGGAQ